MDRVLLAEHNSPSPPQASVEIGNIEERSWRQFVTLANKITRLRVDCELGAASLERIKLAKRTFNGEPFGQVTALEMKIDDEPDELIGLFMPSQLNSIFIWCQRVKDTRLTWVTSCLPTMAPKLTHLRVAVGHHQALDVSQFSALQHFELITDRLTARLWESLATCPLLSKVGLVGCIGVREDSDWPTNQLADLVHFPSLASLKIRCGHSRVMCKLILRSRMPMLETVWWDDDPTMADRFIGRIAAHLKLYSPKIGTGRLHGPKEYMCHFGTGDYEESAIDSGVDSENESDESECYY